MVGFANLLIPLYIYPEHGAGKWDPLLTTAKNNPDVTFTAVVNPYDSPVSTNACPSPDFVDAIQQLNSYQNIRTMGYIHTAKNWNCGPSGTEICYCSAPLTELKHNITKYASWPYLGCRGHSGLVKDLHIDSIFVDEAPVLDGGACYSYMHSLANYARTTVTTRNQGQVLFNAGAAMETSYFDLADVIVVFEDTQAAFRSLGDLKSRTGNGKFQKKSSVIVHSANTTSTAAIKHDVERVLRRKHMGFDSMFYTDRKDDIYHGFPKAWDEIVKQVAKVAKKNKLRYFSSWLPELPGGRLQSTKIGDRKGDSG